MKHNKTIFVGFDIAQDKHYYQISTKDNKVLSKGLINNNKKDAKKIVKKFESIAKKDEIIIGMEATNNYHICMQKYLVSKGYKVVVINPLKTSAYKKIDDFGNKTDSIDANGICQFLIDGKHKKDPRKARAGAVNLIPTTTGAAKAIAKVLPHLAGKINGQAIRIPTPNVSMVDLTVTLKKDVTVESVNQAFKNAANGSMKGILGIDEEQRVSSDFCGEEISTVVPMDTTQVVGNKMVKVLAWYDNEWGYSCRLVDMAVHISK